MTRWPCARRLDYSGIAFLIMGSFVPWLYYSFYCSPQPCFIYLIVVCILGLAAITVSQCDFFATPQYRGVRAGRKNGRRSSLSAQRRRALFQWLFLLRCVCGSGSERRGSHPSLCHQRGCVQSHHHGTDGLAAAHGFPLHHRSLPVCRSHPRTVLPGKVRYLGKSERVLVLFVIAVTH